MRPRVIPPTAECEQTKKSMGSRNAPIVQCGLYALEVINLNVMAGNFLRTCFKSQSLPKSIIFITERHFHMFLTHLQSAQIHENAEKICSNPTVDVKGSK